RPTAVELNSFSNDPSGSSPSPPLEERVGERRPFPAQPLNSTAVPPRTPARNSSDTTLFLASSAERASASTSAIQKALGKKTRVWRRSDGKPVTWEPEAVSASHQRALTLAVAGAGQLACDLEAVAHQPDAVWRD